MKEKTYTASLKENADISKVYEEIRSLAHKNIKKWSQLTHDSTSIEMKCDADFAEMVSKLPSVQSVKDEYKDTIQFYKRADRLNVAAHSVAVGGLAATGAGMSLMLSNPLLFLGLIGGMAAVTLPPLLKKVSFMKKTLTPYYSGDATIAGLPAVMEEFRKKSGPKYSTSLHHLDLARLNDQDAKNIPASIKNEITLFSVAPNAAAFNEPASFIISKPLLKILTLEEKKAVLAHEFTHAAGRHAFTGGFSIAGSALATGSVMLAPAFATLAALPVIWPAAVAAAGAALGSIGFD
jgi:Zn-dependent protease with chaperone function